MGINFQTKETTHIVANSFHLFLKNWPLPNDKLNEFAEVNFEFDQNGRKLSKQLQNTVGKGEIAG